MLCKNHVYNEPKPGEVKKGNYKGKTNRLLSYASAPIFGSQNCIKKYMCDSSLRKYVISIVWKNISRSYHRRDLNSSHTLLTFSIKNAISDTFTYCIYLIYLLFLLSSY